MATENLKVKITADANQAKAEIGKFKDSLKGAVSEGEAATKSIGKVTVALGSMMVALKGVKAAVKNAIAVAEAGDAIKDNAQKVFMNTTAYQEWGYVLKQNGIEMTALKGVMRKFSAQVASGSDTLAKYGITATDVDTAFGQAVAAIQGMSSETDRLSAATELFGNKAAELMPVLNLTNAETQNLMNSYRLLGGTMSNELIAASDTCSDSITALRAAWGGLKNVLAAYVIPIITKVVQWLTVAIAYVRIFLKALFGIKETFGGKSGNSKKSIAGSAASTAKSTGNTAGNLKKAAKQAKELKRTLMGIDELSRLAEKASSGSGSSGGGGGGGGSVSVPSVGDAGSFDGIISDETLTKIQDFQDKIEAVKDKLNGAYLIMKGLVEISLGNPIQGFKDLKDGLEKLFPWLGNVKDKWDELKEKLAGKIAEAKVKLTDAFSSVWKTVSSVWEKAKQVKGTMTATLKLKLKNTFSKAWNKVKGAWNSIKDKTATITLSFKNAITSGWNKAAKAVNNARNKSSLVKGLFKEPLPYFAKGGVLTAPTAGILGEYAGARSNPEIATPQSLMYETMQKANGDLVGAFASMTRQVIAAIEDKDLSVSIGDEAIARSAQRGNTAYKNRTGRALLTI